MSKFFKYQISTFWKKAEVYGYTLLVMLFFHLFCFMALIASATVWLIERFVFSFFDINTYIFASDVVLIYLVSEALYYVTFEITNSRNHDKYSKNIKFVYMRSLLTILLGVTMFLVINFSSPGNWLREYFVGSVVLSCLLGILEVISYVSYEIFHNDNSVSVIDKVSLGISARYSWNDRS